jgi:hypothetical protein
MAVVQTCGVNATKRSGVLRRSCGENCIAGKLHRGANMPPNMHTFRFLQQNYMKRMERPRFQLNEPSEWILRFTKDTLQVRVRLAAAAFGD